MSIHMLMGGKLQVYRRPESSFWQCSTSINGRQYRHSTKEESLSQAKEVPQDWFLGLMGKARAGLLKTEKTVKDAAAQFTREYEVIIQGQRSPKWIEGHQGRLRLLLLPREDGTVRG